MGRSKTVATDELKKPCQKCGNKFGLSFFYNNRDWKNEFFRDAWCKKCTQAYCVDLEALKEYCKFNKRYFADALYDWAVLKLGAELEEDKKYNNMINTQKKDEIYWKKLQNLYFQHMNRIQYYKFDDELNEFEKKELEEQRKLDPTISSGLELNYGKKKYNVVWCGFYTVGELDYLENYFEGLQRDFKLENSSHLDYAKKVCKASLAMDKAFSDMCDGKPQSEKRFKDFKDIFDQLSQSAKFAEKTRSENDTVGFGSLGELIKKMESTGFLQKEIDFPPDEVDRTIEDFRWTLASIGEDV